MRTLSRDKLDLLIRHRIAENKPKNIDEFYLCVYQAVCGTSYWNPDVPPVHDEAQNMCATFLANWEVRQPDFPGNSISWARYWNRFDYWKNYLEIAQLYLNLNQLPSQLRVDLR